MTPREILLIDDKPQGLRQIEGAIPSDRRHLYAVQHVPSIADYRASGRGKVFMVMLDFFLDHDQTYGHTVAHEIQAEHLVGFSSMLEGSRAIVRAVEERAGYAGEPKLHAIQKLKGSDHNRDLCELFERIL